MSIQLQTTDGSYAIGTVLQPNETIQSPSSPGNNGLTQRRVFDVAPSNVLSRKSRLLISALIISTNLIQVSLEISRSQALANATVISKFVSNFLTFAGGFSITRSLGLDLGPGEANWMAAGYSYVNSPQEGHPCTHS